MKWCTKELLSCLKSFKDDQVSLLNHTLAAPLRVVRKDLYKISSGVCCRLRVHLKVVIWSNGSLKPSNYLSWGRQNFGGKWHSKIFGVKGESVIFTIPSRFLFVFSLIAFLSSSISFRMLLRRSLLAPSLLLLFSSSSFLLTSWFSSYCCYSLISCFYLVSSFILAVSVWICRASVAESWGALDSI